MSGGAFSYSASIFSKDDEEKEISELTKDEREAAINDMYGRRRRHCDGRRPTTNNNDETELQDVEEVADEDNNNNDEVDDDDDESIVNDNVNINNDNDNDNDDDNDISGDLLLQFNDALEEIPDDERLDYDYAEEFYPDLIDNESDPIQFLISTNHDPQLAASRICYYWKLRVEIFKDDAFKPLTLLRDGDCAMNGVIIPYMIQLQTLIRILPNDVNGRTVLCWDKTNILFKDIDDTIIIKYFWFVAHQALQQRSTQENGIVIIVISRDSNWDFPSHNLIRLITQSTNCCLPFNIKCRHVCISSLFATFVLPISKFFASREARQRVQVHNSLKTPTLLMELESFGLLKQFIPKSIGGTYDERPTWIEECQRILKDQCRRKKRQRTTTRRRII